MFAPLTHALPLESGSYFWTVRVRPGMSTRCHTRPSGPGFAMLTNVGAPRVLFYGAEQEKTVIVLQPRNTCGHLFIGGSANHADEEPVNPLVQTPTVAQLMKQNPLPKNSAWPLSMVEWLSGATGVSHSSVSATRLLFNSGVNPLS